MGANWLSDNDVVAFGRGDLYVYTTAFHWSITQFTPASMEVHGVNSIERVYSIVTIILALLIFSSFLSSITGLMQNLQKLRSEKEAQEQLLRRFLVENNISAELGTRISRFLKVNHFSRHLRMNEADLKMLEKLPRVMKNLLHEELHLPVTTRAPFFRRLLNMDALAVKKMCHTAIHQVTYLMEETVFDIDAEGKHMFFLMSGSLEYLHKDDLENPSPAWGETLSDTLTDGAWASDPSLWLRWLHQGQMTAKTSSHVTMLNGPEFHNIMSCSRPSFHYALTFAKLFSHYLSSGITWNTDLWWKSTDVARLARIAEHGHSAINPVSEGELSDGPTPRGSFWETGVRGLVDMCAPGPRLSGIRHSGVRHSRTSGISGNSSPAGSQRSVPVRFSSSECAVEGA